MEVSTPQFVPSADGNEPSIKEDVTTTDREKQSSDDHDARNKTHPYHPVPLPIGSMEGSEFLSKNEASATQLKNGNFMEFTNVFKSDMYLPGAEDLRLYVKGEKELIIEYLQPVIPQILQVEQHATEAAMVVSPAAVSELIQSISPTSGDDDSEVVTQRNSNTQSLAWQRSILDLPSDADQNYIITEYKNDVLTVTVAKRSGDVAALVRELGLGTNGTTTLLPMGGVHTLRPPVIRATSVSTEAASDTPAVGTGTALMVAPAGEAASFVASTVQAAAISSEVEQQVVTLSEDAATATAPIDVTDATGVSAATSSLSEPAAGANEMEIVTAAGDTGGESRIAEEEAAAAETSDALTSAAVIQQPSGSSATTNAVAGNDGSIVIEPVSSEVVEQVPTPTGRLVDDVDTIATGSAVTDVQRGDATRLSVEVPSDNMTGPELVVSSVITQLVDTAASVTSRGKCSTPAGDSSETALVAADRKEQDIAVLAYNTTGVPERDVAVLSYNSDITAMTTIINETAVQQTAAVPATNNSPGMNKHIASETVEESAESAPMPQRGSKRKASADRAVVPEAEPALRSKRLQARKKRSE